MHSPGRSRDHVRDRWCSQQVGRQTCFGRYLIRGSVDCWLRLKAEGWVVGREEPVSGRHIKNSYTTHLHATHWCSTFSISRSLCFSLPSFPYLRDPKQGVGTPKVKFFSPRVTPLYILVDFLSRQPPGKRAITYPFRYGHGSGGMPRRSALTSQH